MLLWLVVALGFVACIVCWHLWQGITFVETATLFVASWIFFAYSLTFVYNKTTRDSYLVSGYVTSMTFRPPLSYQYGSETRYEPARFIIEQKSHKPKSIKRVSRKITKIYTLVKDRNSGEEAVEECFGECDISYPMPYSEVKRDESISILVDRYKFSYTRLGDTSASWRTYFNPVRVSDEIVYSANDSYIPYFTLDDYNSAHRLIAQNATENQSARLEQINSELQNNISIGLIVTEDNLYFEKLRRAWHQGKANDFVVVVNSPDGRTLRNVNVLGWDNYRLKENVSKAIMALPYADIDMMLSAIYENLKDEKFIAADFSKYNFANVKIPSEYYKKILIFQAIFFAYMLTLLHYNPNTKDYKLGLLEIKALWHSEFSPPSLRWRLHPLAPTGLFLYIFVPLAGGLMLLSTL